MKRCPGGARTKCAAVSPGPLFHNALRGGVAPNKSQPGADDAKRRNTSRSRQARGEEPGRRRHRDERVSAAPRGRGIARSGGGRAGEKAAVSAVELGAFQLATLVVSLRPVPSAVRHGRLVVEETAALVAFLELQHGLDPDAVRFRSQPY